LNPERVGRGFHLALTLAEGWNRRRFYATHHIRLGRGGPRRPACLMWITARRSQHATFHAVSMCAVLEINLTIAPLIGAAAALLAVTGVQAAEPDAVTAGRAVAERYCGGCHSTGALPSRLDDAPPFRDLHKRYGPGGLEALLKQGMLTPEPSMEEGNMPGHPRMPQSGLGVDERAYLTTYLRSLEPPPSPGASRGAARPPCSRSTKD